MLGNRSKDLLYKTVVGANGDLEIRRFTGSDQSKKDGGYINLLNALFKFGGIRQTEHIKAKNLYRDVCVRHNPSEIELYIKQIMEYCAMDTQHLPALHNGIEKYKKIKLPSDIPAEQISRETLKRGAYGALIAEKEQDGYTIDVQSFFNLRAAKPKILESMCRHINNTCLLYTSPSPRD